MILRTLAILPAGIAAALLLPVSARAQTGAPAVDRTSPSGTPTPAAAQSGWADLSGWAIFGVIILLAVIAWMVWRHYDRRGRP